MRYCCIFAVCVVMVLTAIHLPAQEQTESAGVWKNPPQRISLDDGFSFIYQHDPSSEITVIQVAINGGKHSVPLERRGLSFITTRLAVDMPTPELVQQLMHKGSTLFFRVEGDYSIISVNTLSENLDETLKIVSGVIRKPLFSSLRINNIKKLMEHREKSIEDSPELLMEHTMLSAFFTNGAYGYSGTGAGTKESRKAIKRKHVTAFHREFFNHDNMVIVVSSDRPKDEIAGLVTTYFSSFPPSPPADAVVVPTTGGKVPEKKHYFLEKDNQQVLIAFGALLPGMSRANYTRIYVLENLLGKGVGSKLWPLRSRQDLAYNLNTKFIQLKGAGLLLIYMKTDAAKKEQAHKALKDLLTGLYKTGLSPEDVASAAVRSRADFLRQNETKSTRSYNIAYFQAMGAGFDFLEGFFTAVDGLTPKEMNRYLKDVLNPDKMVEVVIGPQSTPPRGEETSPGVR